VLLDHTPGYFNLFALQYDYDPTALCPRWLQFLKEVFGDDTEALELLQDWFYYVLTGRTDLQVMLLWIGPKRGGKGTVARVLKKLIGADAYDSLTVDNIKQRFGLQEHIHKSLGVFPDERNIGAPGGKQLVSFILKVTGEDDVPIDIKHKSPWSGRLPMRVIYMGNIMPPLPDSAGAIETRLLPLDTKACFAGKEDRGLEDALAQELPGILNWALEAKLASERSEFVVPASGAALLGDIDAYSNPIRQFLRDCCILENGQMVECATLVRAFDGWRRGNEITTYGDSRWFGRELTAAMRDLAPDVKFERKQPPGAGRRWHYLGIGLPQPSGGARVIH
jgi:putative DNA primase/helicase